MESSMAFLKYLRQDQLQVENDSFPLMKGAKVGSNYNQSTEEHSRRVYSSPEDSSSGFKEPHHGQAHLYLPQPTMTPPSMVDGSLPESLEAFGTNAQTWSVTSAAPANPFENMISAFQAHKALTQSSQKVSALLNFRGSTRINIIKTDLAQGKPESLLFQAFVDYSIDDDVETRLKGEVNRTLYGL
jgi:hypothetical protein